MKISLNLKLKNNNTINDELFKPLIENNIEPLVIDVGARNGMNEGVIPNCYSKYSKLVGFEPNKTEYKKLLTNTTEAEKAGENLSGFKKTKYFDSALWSNQEIRELFITQGDGAVTLMGEPLKEIAENMFLNSSKKSYFKEHVQVKRKEKIACDRLDNLIKDENKIDILKVDVEGAELEVFKGSQKLFDSRSILFIKTEFFFTPYFKESTLLGHQQVFLNNNGFRLIDIDFDHRPYTRSLKTNSTYTQRNSKYGGDAYFILDPDKNKISSLDLHRLGIICLVFNFDALGIDFLREANLISQQSLDEIQNTISQHWNSNRIKDYWSSIPTHLNRFIKRLTNKSN